MMYVLLQINQMHIQLFDSFKCFSLLPNPFNYIIFISFCKNGCIYSNQNTINWKYNVIIDLVY